MPLLAASKTELETDTARDTPTLAWQRATVDLPSRRSLLAPTLSNT
jgi:hypothetical protein